MHQNSINCDVLVVGAGPAGSLAASTMARHGVNVLLIDKKRRLGEKPHCGEFVPQKLFAEFNLSSKIIDQKVDSMETIIIEGDLPSLKFIRFDHFRKLNDNSDTDSGEIEASRYNKTSGCAESFKTPSVGYIIDRQTLDMSLAKGAAFHGALVLSGAKLVRLEHEYSLVSYGRENIRVGSKIVIAADGPNSTIGKTISHGAQDFLLGVQCQVPLTRELNRTIVFFHKSITYGYGWLFPKGKSANFGLGMFPQKHGHPTELLEYFLGLFIDWGILKRGIFSRSKGLIPISGIRRDLVQGRLALVGDAAGLTHPITGAGVPQAMVSGELAGIAAVESLKHRNIDLLRDYQTQLRKLYSGPLNHAKAKRQLMTNIWNCRDMKSICAETWIAFKGYGKRVRDN